MKHDSFKSSLLHDLKNKMDFSRTINTKSIEHSNDLYIQCNLHVNYACKDVKEIFHINEIQKCSKYFKSAIDVE